VEVALHNIAIFLPRIEIDPDGECAEIEKRLHLRTDARPETKHAAALPVDLERTQSLT
jgi:hypothetical protein